MKSRAFLLLSSMGLGCSASYVAPTPAEPANSTPAAVTVHLTSSGVDQQNLTVAAGSAVAFTNDDSAVHQIASNPHPLHTDCPELNGPALPAGASFTATMTGQRSVCGFHDHLDPLNTALQGTIHVTAVTAAVDGGGGAGGGGGGPYP